MSCTSVKTYSVALPSHVANMIYGGYLRHTLNAVELQTLLIKPQHRGSQENFKESYKRAVEGCQ